MNKKIQTKFGPYPFLVILLCTVACTLRTVATFLGVNAFGYFENGTLFRVSAWIVACCVFILLTLPLAYRKRTDALVEQTTPHTFLPSLMLGMLFLFFVGEGIFSLLDGPFLPTTEKLAYLLALVLSLLSCIYFFSLALLESTTNDHKANLGMACVLFFGIYAAYLYLDITIPRNAHLEVSEEMMLIALSLYFLYEVRISLGKQKQSLYVMFAMIAGTLCAFNTVPTLIYFIANGKLLASSLTVFLLSLGALVFIILRLAIFEKSPTDAPIALVERLVKFAKAREVEVSAIEARYAPKTPTEEGISVEEPQQSLTEESTEEALAAPDASPGEEEAVEETVSEEVAEVSETPIPDQTRGEAAEPLPRVTEAEEGDATPVEVQEATDVTEPRDESEREFIFPTENIDLTLYEAEPVSELSESNEPKEE